MSKQILDNFNLIKINSVDVYLHKPVEDKALHKKPIQLLEHLKKLKLIEQEEHVYNIVKDAGEIWIAELLAGKATDDSVLIYGAGQLGWGLQYIAVGTGSGAGDQNDFKLQTLAIGTNNCKPSTNSFNAGANNKFTVSVTFLTTEANDASPLREAGIFLDDCDTTEPTSETDEGNRMFNRTVFAAITKTTDFELTIQWTIEIGSLTA